MGMNSIDAMAQMRNAYARGIEARIGAAGKITEKGSEVYDSAAVKKLAIIAGTETARNVLRIDEIIPKRCESR